MKRIRQVTDSMDRETRDSLLETLAGLKASQMQYAARRDKRFWKNNGIPGSLSDVISGLTKEEMNKICKSYGLKRMSSLKKADLAPKLARLVPERFDRVLRTLDQGRYGLLKAVVKNSGMLKGEVETAKARALLGSCLVFPGTYDHEKVVYMPPELIDVFNRTDGAELKRIIKRNTEWITLTHGMLYYYGVIGMRPLLEKIEALTGAKVDLLEFEDVLTPAIKFYRQVHYTASGLRDYRVFDTEKLVNEQKSRQSVDYYPFTKKQLMEAGASECNDRTPVMTSLLDFLAEHYDLNENAKNDLANELIKRINEGNTLNEIIKYLGSRLELPSFEFMQLLTEKTTELYNNTRQWALKGHTPGELFREEKKFLKPLPAKPFAVEQTESKVVDIKTRKKVGRNAPCPCGSGKKFKKCCGG